MAHVSGGVGKTDPRPLLTIGAIRRFTMSDYRLKKGVFGSAVLYDCPSCGAPLSSSIAKAGSMDTCPDCARSFTVPGIEEKYRAQQQKAAKPKAPTEPKKSPTAAPMATPSPAVTNGLSPEFVEIPEFVEVRSHSIPPAVRPTPPPASALTKKAIPTSHQFGDRLLELAFAAARIFSVFVIAVCCVALAVIAMLALWTVSEYRVVKAEPLESPSAADFKRNLAAVRSPERKSSESEASPYTTDGNVDPVKALLAKHELERAYVSSDIYSVKGELNDSDFEMFIKDLDKLLGPIKNEDKSLAVTWFCMEYNARIAAYDQDIEGDEINNAIATTRLMLILWFGLVTFLGLMAFVAFPLLIRIEANTRPTMRVSA